MKELKDRYTYFNRLEVKIKTAIVIYACLLMIGLGVGGFGVDRIILFSQTMRIEIIILCALGALALILGAAFWIRNINKVEGLHIVLDTSLFGFLKKSNDTILDSLLFSLKPEERSALEALQGEKQSEVVQSVFTELSNDPEVFESMIKSRLFSTWTWYWSFVYGAITFTLLTIAQFVFVATQMDSYARLIFAVFWFLACLHLTLVLTFGFRLSKMTKSSVDTIVVLHKSRIASTLRQYLSEDDQAEEADVIEDE